MADGAVAARRGPPPAAVVVRRRALVPPGAVDNADAAAGSLLSSYDLHRDVDALPYAAVCINPLPLPSAAHAFTGVVDTHAVFTSIAACWQAAMLHHVTGVGRTALRALGGVGRTHLARDGAANLRADQLTVLTLALVATDRVRDAAGSAFVNDAVDLASGISILEKLLATALRRAKGAGRRSAWPTDDPATAGHRGVLLLGGGRRRNCIGLRGIHESLTAAGQTFGDELRTLAGLLGIAGLGFVDGSRVAGQHVVARFARQQGAACSAICSANAGVAAVIGGKPVVAIVGVVAIDALHAARARASPATSSR